jgi:hypothetical protein
VDILGLWTAEIGKAGQCFADFLVPETLNGMWDPFEFGLLPRLSGFHRKDYSKQVGEFGGGLVNG